MPKNIILLLAVALRLLVCRKNKEINFFQDIGDSTSFDFKLTEDGINNDQIIMAVFQETGTGKATFLLLLTVWYLLINQQ